MENGRNPFYCEDAAEVFLEKESVDLFIGHPPYYMAELEGNGGDPNLQMQNASDMEQYWDRMLDAFKHMEYALKPDGHMFIALSNSESGLGMLGKIQTETSLKLQTMRIWDFSKQFDNIGNHTAVFAHFTKDHWDPGTRPQGPFVLTNLWSEAWDELAGYEEYVTAGTAPMGIYTEMIENYSKPGDVVADIFAGSGTVCLVAMLLGRRFIFNDVSEDKVIMAKKRIDDAYESIVVDNACTFGQEELRS